MPALRPHLVAGVLGVMFGLVLVGTPLANARTGSASSPRAYFWTTRQAESIAVVRGQPVHVRACRGLGQPRRAHATERYSRFACVAGTGLDWERFDSVSVTYVLVPTGPWHGACSAHALRNVRFIGGTGVP